MAGALLHPILGGKTTSAPGTACLAPEEQGLLPNGEPSQHSSAPQKSLPDLPPPKMSHVLPPYPGSSLASLLPLDSVTVVRAALGTLHLLGPSHFLVSPEFVETFPLTWLSALGFASGSAILCHSRSSCWWVLTWWDQRGVWTVTPLSRSLLVSCKGPTSTPGGSRCGVEMWVVSTGDSLALPHTRAHLNRAEAVISLSSRPPEEQCQDGAMSVALEEEENQSRERPWLQEPQPEPGVPCGLSSPDRKPIPSSPDPRASRCHGGLSC
ncbi:hypothetical protein P7K49_024487 [Saguinus oedipus]|uniref:Uncharacterized protein n=1 Tax=Saguinus oedipus TaxID=9490 RepID=A0ABQ9UQD5_SAGOE|nr:hypothetical protein P7K49_024487 [Saguinus oedipus]